MPGKTTLAKWDAKKLRNIGKLGFSHDLFKGELCWVEEGFNKSRANVKAEVTNFDIIDLPYILKGKQRKNPSGEYLKTYVYVHSDNFQVKDKDTKFILFNEYGYINPYIHFENPETDKYFHSEELQKMVQSWITQVIKYTDPNSHRYNPPENDYFKKYNERKNREWIKK